MTYNNPYSVLIVPMVLIPDTRRSSQLLIRQGVNDVEELLRSGDQRGVLADSAQIIPPSTVDSAMQVRMAQQITSNIYPVDMAMGAPKFNNRLTNGGIDLGRTVVDVRSAGELIQTAFDDPAMLRLLLNSDGLAPIIYDVKAMTPSMVDHFVGLN